MFGGRAQDARFIAQDCGKLGRRHRAEIGANFAFAALRIGAGEDNAGIGIGRTESEVHGQTGMNPNPGDRYLFTQRGLPCGFHTLVPSIFRLTQRKVGAA
jgi:hypothetical protein